LSVSLIWATPEGDKLVGFLARVSNPKATLDDPSRKLIKYLIDHKHWSPFEMVNACVEINTTRDISHQIIRHRSLSVQEFSGRYAEYDALLGGRELRLKGANNRQGSVPCDDPDFHATFEGWGREISDTAGSNYRRMLNLGVANEVARSFLPEGLVPTKMYVNGTLRSWIHYWSVRCTPETQKEHRVVAEETRDVILYHFPEIAKAIGYAEEG
jgi:thymidylate synthase (FAD)